MIDTLHPAGGLGTPRSDDPIRTKKLEKTAQSLPVLETLFSDLEKLIDFYGTVSAIDLESKLSAETQILANQRIVKVFKAELKKFQTEYKNYQKSQEVPIG